jgi:hypothetical protein
MARARDDFQFFGASQTRQSILVELDHAEVGTPND